MSAENIKHLISNYMVDAYSETQRRDKLFEIICATVDYIDAFVEMMNRNETTKVWRIFSSKGDNDLYIQANTFDDALKIARKIDPDYNGGQLIEKG